MTHWLNGNRQPAFKIITTVEGPTLEKFFYTLWALVWSKKKGEGGPSLACSRRSDRGAQAKNKASERARKKTRGYWGKGLDFCPLSQSPLVFPALSLALFFARAPLSERLEQDSPPLECSTL